LSRVYEYTPSLGPNASASPVATLVNPTIPIRIGRWKRREGNGFKVSRAASAWWTAASTSPCSTRAQPCMISDHWIAKVMFALMMTALVGGQLAMQLGVPLLPDNWP